MTSYRTTLRVPALALGAALLAAGATGCSSSGGDDSAGATSADREVAATGPEAPQDMAGSDATTSRAGKQARTTDLVQERAIIATGVVSLRSDDATGARSDVLKVVDVHRGQVTDEETSTDDEGRVQTSRMVVRVPVSDFYATIDELEKVAELESSNKSSQDVSFEVIDTDVRIRAQERSLRRVEILLERAQTIRDVVSVESELTRRQAELDSLKSQQAYLADQTSMSTITVYVEQKRDEEKEEVETDDAGFLTGLDNGWTSLVAFATIAATILGALLPWLVILALFGIPTWLVARRLARRRPVVSAPTEG